MATLKKSGNGRINFSVSLPKKMGRLIDGYARKNMQTRSEFVRFLLQKEIVDRREPVTLSKKELAELDAIEAEMQAGEYITLGRLRYDMGSKNKQKGGKKITKSQ